MSISCLWPCASITVLYIQSVGYALSQWTLSNCSSLTRPTVTAASEIFSSSSPSPISRTLFHSNYLGPGPNRVQGGIRSEKAQAWTCGLNVDYHAYPPSDNSSDGGVHVIPLPSSPPPPSPLPFPLLPSPPFPSPPSLRSTAPLVTPLKGGNLHI